MQTALIVAIAVLAVIAIGAAVYFGLVAQRRRNLRTRFGPEYDRTVEATGDQRAAERELAAREERRKRLDIHQLEPGARAEYAQRWIEVQARFVDLPADSLREADALVNQLMGQMGYPMESFEQMAAHISVDHPQVVEDYRAAHAASVASAAEDGASTEDLRRGIQRYRSLFESLLGQRAAPNADQAARDGAEQRDATRAEQG
jgi:hypothetical protein